MNLPLPMSTLEMPVMHVHAKLRLSVCVHCVWRLQPLTCMAAARLRYAATRLQSMIKIFTSNKAEGFKHLETQ